MSGITYSGAAVAQEPGGSLFSGRRIWLSSRVPAKKHYVDLITSNGGQVVPLEKDADVWIADHLKPRDIPRGCLSYQFIDECVKQGQLVAQQSFRCDPEEGQAREAGVPQSGRRTRIPFTKKDEAILWQWVQEAKTKGRSLQGNTIYQELAAKHPRHTYQSWRDRWIKYMSHSAPPAYLMETQDAMEESRSLMKDRSHVRPPHELSPLAAQRIGSDVVSSPVPGRSSSDMEKGFKRALVSNSPTSFQHSPEAVSRSSKASPGERAGLDPFTQADQEFLLLRADRIMEMLKEQRNLQDYWAGVADGRGKGTPQQWAIFFGTAIFPLHQQRSNAKTGPQSDARRPSALKSHPEGHMATRIKSEPMDDKQSTSKYNPMEVWVEECEPEGVIQTESEGEWSHGNLLSSPVERVSQQSKVPPDLKSVSISAQSFVQGQRGTISQSPSATATYDRISNTSVQAVPNALQANRASLEGTLSTTLVPTTERGPSNPNSGVTGEEEDSAHEEDDESDGDEGVRIIEEWTQRMVDLGYSAERAGQALYMATKDTQVAEVALEVWRRLGMPDDDIGRGPPMEGLWTDEDDEALKAGNEVLVKQLKRKHGKENVMDRVEFLDDYEEE